MKYLIIGNGVAGTKAALSIRKDDPFGEATIISDRAAERVFEGNAATEEFKKYS